MFNRAYFILFMMHIIKKYSVIIKKVNYLRICLRTLFRPKLKGVSAIWASNVHIFSRIKLSFFSKENYLENSKIR